LKVFHDLYKIPPGLTSVVSVGTFDGVHKGHQAIIRKMTEIASVKKLQSVVLTFDPHPRYTLKKDDEKLKLLLTNEEKLRRFEVMGVDIVVIISFTTEFAKTPYEIFIKKYLVDALGMKCLVVGFDHRFGENRSGNHQTLIDLSRKYDYAVIEKAALTENDDVISSTKIRSLLDTGQIETANRYLGYAFPISGFVVEGNRTGNKLGFPTANIIVDNPSKQIPAKGVYAVKVLIEDKIYNGMCNIGNKPTFENQPLTIETNIFDFDKNIYHKKIGVFFISFIRSEFKFENTELLITQIEQDKRNVLKILNEDTTIL